MQNKETRFFELALESNALQLGDFTLKSGRKSPYFFNIGSFFNEGYIKELAELYAVNILENELDFNLIFGPAYKGIPLAASVAASLSSKVNRPIPFAFDRKEVKSHGEGGKVVGNLKDKKVLIVDDVLTAGTAIKQSVEIIHQAKGKVSCCLVALDREEVIDDILARDKILREIEVDVFSIAQISRLVDFFESNNQHKEASIINKYINSQ